MDYQSVRNKREQFLSLTTLYPEEFDLLLSPSEAEWYKFYRVYTLEGKRRNKTSWNPQKDTPTLPTVEDKLFFLLTYFKQHPLQQFHAASFGLSQPKVSLWVKHLTPIVEKALKKLGCLPCKDGSSLDSFMGQFEKVEAINQDVVEQTMPRPTDDQAQKEMYSGKKKSYLQKQSRLFRQPICRFSE